MKTGIIIFFASLAVACANPAQYRTVDISGRTAPGLSVNQANDVTIQWSLLNNGTNYTIPASETPIMWWASSNRAAGVSTAICTKISGNVFTARWTPASINTNGSMTYGVGVRTVTNNVTIAAQGTLVIVPDPYATGAGTVQLTTNLNLSLYTFTGNLSTPGTITGGLFVGDGSGLTGVGGAATNGLAAILYVDAATNALRAEIVPLIPGAVDTNAVYQRATNDAVQGARVWTNGLVGASITNGLVGASITNGLVGTSITNGLVGPSVTNGLVGASITNGLESIEGSIAKTNTLRLDIADGLDFSAAPTVNGNPVLTNAPTGGTETDPVYTTGLTARLSGILGTAAYSNGTAFLHASRIGELTNETLFKIYTNNATWYGAEQVTVTPTNEFTINEGFITGYTGSRQHVVIPYEIGGYPIEAIEPNVFQGNSNLVSIVFPDNGSLEMQIGGCCFESCTNLERVVFNGLVFSIGSSAFEICPKLVSVNFKKAMQPADNNIYVGSTHVTNYVSTDSYGWGQTFSGRPVVIPPLSTYWLSVNNTNVMEMVTSNTDAIASSAASISILRARTNSCPSEIVAPEIRAYPRGTLYGTNAIVTLSRSTSIGHAWFQVGYQTNALSPFVAIDGYHLASTTNADATFTNVSIPPQTRISINVTNLATVTSNFNSDIGFKEP